MEKRCSICECIIFKGYYCWKCYNTYKEDIFNKVPWVRFMLNCERKRRDKTYPNFIYLGEGNWDIDNDGNLVPTYR